MHRVVCVIINKRSFESFFVFGSHLFSTLTSLLFVVSVSTCSHQAGLLAWMRTRDTLSLALAVEESVARAVLRARGHARDRVRDAIIDFGGKTAHHLVVGDGFVGPKIP